MAALKIDIPGMDELGVIRYLLDEIEEEKEYNEAYNKAINKALEEVEKKGGHYWEYMDSSFDRLPRSSVIKDDTKMMRRLLLKIGQRC